MISSKAVLFERGVSDKIYILKKDDMTCIYVISVEQNYNSYENKNAIRMNRLDILCYYDVIDDENEIIIGEKIVKDNMNNNCIVGEVRIQGECNENKNAKENDLSEKLRSIASQLAALTLDEQTRLLNLLIKKQNLFIEKVGGATGFEYQIKLTKQNPSIYRSYPIPLS